MRNTIRFILKVLIVGIIVLMPFYVCSLMLRYKWIAVLFLMLAGALMIKEIKEVINNG